MPLTSVMCAGWPGRKGRDRRCEGADKAKDSPEAALYVKAGRGETPVKISWDKKVEISLQRYVKKLLMARCQPLRPQRKKAGLRERAACRTGCLEKRHKKSAVARAFLVLSCKGIR